MTRDRIAARGHASPSRSDVVLDVAGLRAAYGHVPVLHGIDFQLKAGEAVGIVGHNGVGKTTFLKTLIGLVPTTAGRISIDGIDVTRMKAHDRSRLGIGYVPQGRGILPGLTALENLRLAWTPRLGRHRTRGDRARRRHAAPAQGDPRPQGRRALGRRAADPGARPRPHRRARGCSFSTSRRKASSRRSSRRSARSSPACASATSCRSSSSSRTSTSSSTSPTASSSSSAAGSSARSTRTRRRPAASPSCSAWARCG